MKFNRLISTIGLCITFIISLSSCSFIEEIMSEESTVEPTVERNYINDTVITGKLGAMVVDCTNTSVIKNYETRFNYIVLTVAVVNAANKEMTLTSKNFYLFDGSKRYEVNVASIMLEYDSVYYPYHLGSDLDAVLQMAFEVPTKSYESDYYLEIDAGMMSLGQRVYLNKF